MNIDEMIDTRKRYRDNKNYKASDDVRNLLDKELVFVFDHKDGAQEIHYLTEKYFLHMHKTKCKSNREYLEYRIRLDREAEDRMNAWIYSMRN